VRRAGASWPIGGCRSESGELRVYRAGRLALRLLGALKTLPLQRVVTGA